MKMTSEHTLQQIISVYNGCTPFDKKTNQWIEFYFRSQVDFIITKSFLL